MSAVAEERLARARQKLIELDDERLVWFYRFVQRRVYGSLVVVLGLWPAVVALGWSWRAALAVFPVWLAAGLYGLLQGQLLHWVMDEQTRRRAAHQ